MTTRAQPKPSSSANDGVVLAFALGGLAGVMAYHAATHPVPVASSVLLYTAEAMDAVLSFIGHPEAMANPQLTVSILFGALAFMVAIFFTSKGSDATERQALRLKARRELRIQAKHERDTFIVH